MRDRTSLDVICSYLPERIRKVLRTISDVNELTEIRLRSSKPVALVYAGKCRFITSDGGETFSPSNSSCVRVSAEEIAGTVDALCHYSQHSCSKELTEGYFVIENGIRVGVAGRKSETQNGLIREFTSLNFRIAREVLGCGEYIFRKYGGSGILIAGSVNSGKTTILRDLCRLTGNIEKGVLIDERNEISGTYSGIASFDLGAQTDVLVGYRRAEGIISAVRTLSPDVIFCDEISVQEDVDAILSVLGSGVRFTATIHAGSYEELMGRKIARELIEAGAFEKLVLLKDFKADVIGVRRLKNAG